MAERVLDDGTDSAATGERWWSGGTRTATPAAPPTPTPDGAPEPSGYSPARRRGLLAVAVTSGIVIVVAGVAIGVLVAGRTPALELEIVDATGENPLPGGLRVTVNGDPMTSRFSGDTAALTVDDAFADQDDASIVVHVPERVDFTIDRALAGDGPVEVLIVDDAVLVGDTKHERVNPVQDARDAEEAAEQKRIADQEAERARVELELVGIGQQMRDARQIHDAIWTGRATAPYTEIQAVTDRDVLPIVDAALGRLGALSSADEPSQAAIVARNVCVAATRSAYVRNAYADLNLTDEQNGSQQRDVWNVAAAACVDADAKLSALW